MKRTPETIDLMLKVADQIEEEPERYNQYYYVMDSPCGTQHCIAGWALVLSGKAQVEIDTYTDRAWTCIFVDLETGGWEDPVELGREALGLNEEEAWRLFGASWKPAENMSVPDALRKLAWGADIEDVSSPASFFKDHPDDIDYDEPF
jgi:hypothetical protein